MSKQTGVFTRLRRVLVVVGLALVALPAALNAAPTAPGARNMTLVGNSDHDGALASDLARQVSGGWVGR